jgi:hypothetical protein
LKGKLKTRDMTHEKPQKDNSRLLLAAFLILFGMIWLLKRSGVYFHFPVMHFNGLFAPVREAVSTVAHVVFSWPFILIVIGLVLMAGKRRTGVVFLVIGGIFLIPKIIFPGMVMMVFLPLLLIGLGVAIVARLL